MRPKTIRESAGVSQMLIAARSGKSLPSIRLFEADPESVRPATRRALEPVYAQLAAGLAESGDRAA